MGIRCDYKEEGNTIAASSHEYLISRKLKKRGPSTGIARKSAQRWRFETNDYMTGNYGSSDRVWVHATLREYKGETLVERGPDSFGHEAIGFSSLRFSFTFVSTMLFSLELWILKLVLNHTAKETELQDRKVITFRGQNRNLADTKDLFPRLHQVVD